MEQTSHMGRSLPTEIRHKTLLRQTAPADEASETLMPKRQKIVAIIEDDASILRAAGDLLDAHGFATLAFASAEEFQAAAPPTRSIASSWISISAACRELNLGPD